MLISAMTRRPSLLTEPALHVVGVMQNVEMGDAYDRWRGLSFPRGSTTDEVDELHATLAQWDAFVANTVIPVVTRNATYDEGVLDFNAELAALDVSIKNAMVRAETRDRQRLAAYGEYVDALKGALAEARTQSG